MTLSVSRYVDRSVGRSVGRSISRAWVLCRPSRVSLILSQSSTLKATKRIYSTNVLKFVFTAIQDVALALRRRVCRERLWKWEKWEPENPISWHNKINVVNIPLLCCSWIVLDILTTTVMWKNITYSILLRTEISLLKW